MVRLTPKILQGESPSGDFPSGGGGEPSPLREGKGQRGRRVCGSFQSSPRVCGRRVHPVHVHEGLRAAVVPFGFCVGHRRGVHAYRVGIVSLDSTSSGPRGDPRPGHCEEAGSPLRLASSARTGAAAQEGVISPNKSPIASTVVIGRVEASKAPRRTSKGRSTPLVVGFRYPHTSAADLPGSPYHKPSPQFVPGAGRVMQDLCRPVGHGPEKPYLVLGPRASPVGLAA